MSDTQFTPGEWYRDTDGTLPIRIFVEDERWNDSVKTIIAEIGLLRSNSTWDYREDDANANLMVAAPDLYAALELLLDCYCDNAKPEDCCTCIKEDSIAIEHQANPCEVCVAVAALAKARGEKS